MSAAWRNRVSLARPLRVIFLDADDEWLPTFLESTSASTNTSNGSWRVARGRPARRGQRPRGTARLEWRPCPSRPRARRQSKEYLIAC